MANHTQSESTCYSTEEESFARPDESRGVVWRHTREKANDVPRDVDDKQQAPVDEGADTVVARYFSDVKRYGLLSRSEELALWERIDTCQQRVRRALYVAPTTLPTLLRLWQQVEQGDLALGQFIEPLNSSSSETTLRTHARAMLRELQVLDTQRRELNQQVPRQARQAALRLAWVERCNALTLHPDVHQTLYEALEQARQHDPQSRDLQAAHHRLVRARRQLQQAKEQMLQANLRLVVHIANRYRGNGLAFSDLIQEGNLGLMRALDKFEARRGLKFITYAYWWVRQAIGRAIINQHRTVRLPNHIVERKQKLRATEERLWRLKGRTPTLQELSEALDWPQEEIETLYLATQSMLQLHQPANEAGPLLEESLEDEEVPKPDQCLATTQLQRLVATCFASLTDREAHVLRLRFGFETDHPHTLQEIGAMFGLSRERIRQIEQAALDKLRQPQFASLLADFASA